MEHTTDGICKPRMSRCAADVGRERMQAGHTPFENEKGRAYRQGGREPGIAGERPDSERAAGDQHQDRRYHQFIRHRIQKCAKRRRRSLHKVCIACSNLLQDACDNFWARLRACRPTRYSWTIWYPWKAGLG